MPRKSSVSPRPPVAAPDLPIPRFEAQAKRPLTAAQRLFNERIERIAQLKARIIEVEAELAQAQRRYQQEIVPLVEIVHELRIQLLFKLDAQSVDKLFRQREQTKISFLIRQLAVAILERDPDNEHVQFVYGQHSSKGYAQQQAEAEAQSKAFAEEMLRNLFDMDVDLDNLDEEKVADIDEKFREREKNLRDAFARPARDEPDDPERQAEAEAELSNLGKAVRSLYMRLAKLLHPDRATTEAERAEKTRLMQRVTAAYKQEDFFELLSLQHEVRAEAADLSQLADTELAYYNQVLENQVAEVEEELRAMTHFGDQAEFYQAFAGNSRQMGQKFRRRKREVQEQTEAMRQDLAIFGDRQRLRDFLRRFDISGYDEETPFGLRIRL